MSQEAPTSTDFPLATAASSVGDTTTPEGSTEGTVSELAGLVKVLLQSQAARDNRMEQVMVKQDQRWQSMQHQFQQIQHQLPHEVVLGQDLPILCDLVSQVQSCYAVTQAQSARADFSELPFADVDLEGGCEKRRKSKKERRKLKFQGSVASRQVEQLPLLEGPLNMTIPAAIAELQKKDPTLQDWFQKVSEVDGAREPGQSQVLRHCIYLIFYSKASAAAPNSMTPGSYEMHRLPAERSAHDIKAPREQSKSSRSRMLYKCRGPAALRCHPPNQSALLRCISNKPSINNRGCFTAVNAHGFANLHHHPNTARCHLYVDGDYDRAAISSIRCYFKNGGLKFLVGHGNPAPSPLRKRFLLLAQQGFGATYEPLFLVRSWCFVCRKTKI
ncbi:hypothetical protein DPX16_4192 [Anabarilius grahami]|uniref:Uncharacterized protein n=1 Tax=Anabarilius grahami TaxID=495550 RepID=A0A3N0YQ79_ANAGA|nr:hypothetical protein DPX16_4192 [Anabarilius grahami]